MTIAINDGPARRRSAGRRVAKKARTRLRVVRWPGFDEAMRRWRRAPDRDVPHLAVVGNWQFTQAVAALSQGVRGVIGAKAPAAIRRAARAIIAAGGCFLWLPEGDEAPTPKLPRLSPAQLEVLRLVAAGHTSREIAATLKRSVRTVETHRLNILRRTGLKPGTPFLRLALSLYPQA